MDKTGRCDGWSMEILKIEEIRIFEFLYLRNCRNSEKSCRSVKGRSNNFNLSRHKQLKVSPIWKGSSSQRVMSGTRTENQYTDQYTVGQVTEKLVIWWPEYWLSDHRNRCTTRSWQTKSSGEESRFTVPIPGRTWSTRSSGIPASFARREEGITLCVRIIRMRETSVSENGSNQRNGMPIKDLQMSQSKQRRRQANSSKIRRCTTRITQGSAEGPATHEYVEEEEVSCSEEEEHVVSGYGNQDKGAERQSVRSFVGVVEFFNSCCTALRTLLSLFT